MVRPDHASDAEFSYSATLKQSAAENEARTVWGADDKKDPDSPAYECDAYRAMKPDVDMMRDVYGGTPTMRAKKEKYLPKHPMERGKYDDRLKIALALNVLKRTSGGLVGMIFRRDPKQGDDLDAHFVDAWENIDKRGHELPLFLRLVATDALVDGHAWIHVESPREQAETRQSERDNDVRPYWIEVKKRQAINWQYEIRGGEPVLTLFAYTVCETRPKGRFGQEAVDQIRVLREVDIGLVNGELWELQDVEENGQKKKRWVMVDEYMVDAPTVPVVFVPGEEGEDAFMSEPPLRDLAYEQIEHYRQRSEMQKAGTFSAISVPYLFASDAIDSKGNPKVTWGSDGMLVSSDPEAAGGVIESSGNGLDWMSNQLDKIEGRMAMLGLQMLVRPSVQPGSDVTATSDVMRKSEGDAALVVFAKALESAANEAIRIHAAYRQIEEPGALEINLDFYDQLIAPELLARLIELVANDMLSLETLWTLLIQGELLDEMFDPDEEQVRLEAAVAKRMARAEDMLGDVPDDEDDVDEAA